MRLHVWPVELNFKGQLTAYSAGRTQIEVMDGKGFSTCPIYKEQRLVHPVAINASHDSMKDIQLATREGRSCIRNP